MNSVLNNLKAAKQNISQLLVVVTLAANNPTPANIDSAVTAINSGTFAGPLIPKPTYSVDGESYNWAEYLTTLMNTLAALNDLIQKESMPWVVRSTVRP